MGTHASDFQFPQKHKLAEGDLMALHGDEEARSPQAHRSKLFF
jgi:hypothetical protein